MPVYRIRLGTHVTWERECEDDADFMRALASADILDVQMVLDGLGFTARPELGGEKASSDSQN